MSKRRVVVLGGTLLAIGLIAVGMVPSAAQEPPPPIAAEFVSGRAMFTDDVDLMIKNKKDGRRTEVVRSEDPSRTVVARFTVQPGAQFPWHSTTGPAVASGAEGRQAPPPAALGSGGPPGGGGRIPPGPRPRVPWSSTWSRGPWSTSRP